LKVKIHKIIILSVVLYGCETWSSLDWRCKRTGCWEEYLDPPGSGERLEKTA
jgi:hypothetical protein